MKCWQCGVEPIGLVDATTLDDPEPSYVPTGWPLGDHEHAVAPPTPDELADAGHRALERVRALS